MKYTISFLLLAICSSLANAAVTPATWSSFNSSSAIGDLQGIGITATVNADSRILGITSGWFEAPTWDTGMPLPAGADGVVVGRVNGGDSATFSFSSPLLDNTLFYIENFDSSSSANINFLGATSVSVLESSASISYVGAGAGGFLASSNMGFDGEGDVIFSLEGPVSSITLDYQSGDGANGVIYTLATNCPDPTAVPEPASAVVMAGLFALGGGVALRRKKRNEK